MISIQRAVSAVVANGLVLCLAGCGAHSTTGTAADELGNTERSSDQDQAGIAAAADGGSGAPRDGGPAVMSTCSSGGDEDASLKKLAKSQLRPSDIVLDSTNAYWTDLGRPSGVPEGGTVMSVPLKGGPVTTLAAGHSSPMGIAHSSAGVYFADWDDGIFFIPAAGGAPTQLETTGGWGLALYGSELYWTDGISAVLSAPVSGGTPTTVASGLDSPTAIAVNATTAYWTGYGVLMSVPIAGGKPTTLATGNPSSLAIDGTSLYWTDQGPPGPPYEGTVWKMPLAGGTKTKLATNQKYIGNILHGITVDCESVYWTTGAGGETGAVVRLPLAGGTPTTLASGFISNMAIAVNNKSAVWLVDGELNPQGAVMKLTPK